MSGLAAINGRNRSNRKIGRAAGRDIVKLRGYRVSAEQRALRDRIMAGQNDSEEGNCLTKSSTSSRLVSYITRSAISEPLSAKPKGVDWGRQPHKYGSRSSASNGSKQPIRCRQAVDNVWLSRNQWPQPIKP